MKDFIAISDFSSSEIKDLLDLAIKLKKQHFKKGNKKIFKGKVLGMIFQKPSLRTRVSFDMAMRHCGGDALYLSPNEIGLGKRESIADVARVLSGYVDGIMARVFDHEHILQLAKYGSVPVINGLSDYNHPAQALADIFTIMERRNNLTGLKMAYVGDSNNVTRSLLFAAMHMGMHMTMASPAGYMLSEDDLDDAQALNQHGVQIEVFEDPAKAVADADVIYTDVWTSMGQEAETAVRLKVFPPYQINQQLLAHAKPDCLVLHCLPAHRGEEITDEVADGPNSVLFLQAANRLHAQKAILAKLLA